MIYIEDQQYKNIPHILWYKLNNNEYIYVACESENYLEKWQHRNIMLKTDPNSYWGIKYHCVFHNNDYYKFNEYGWIVIDDNKNYFLNKTGFTIN